MRVIESLTMPKSHREVNGDVIAGGRDVVAMMDMVTPKPWDPPAILSPPALVLMVEHVLDDLSASATMMDVVKTTTRLMETEKRRAGVSQGNGFAFVMGVIHGPGRWVGRCGDVHLLVDGVAPWPTRRRAEHELANRRADVIRQALRGGATITELRRRDAGREDILPGLKALEANRNSHGKSSFAVIDGTMVPPRLIDHSSLPHTAHEVVMATDGYPVVHRTLQESEGALMNRLRADPLMIEAPAQTKGCMLGSESFDDRAYLRIDIRAPADVNCPDGSVPPVIRRGSP